jgi:hypothetical protein
MLAACIKTEKIMETIPYPRCAEDVYSLGIRLQQYLADICLSLAKCRPESERNMLRIIAKSQLEHKKEMLNLMNTNLNQALAYFYENGGPIIELPVSEAEVKDIHLFFDKSVANFFSKLDTMFHINSKSEINKLDAQINSCTIELFIMLGKLYKTIEVKEAFAELIRIKKSQPLS